MSEEKNLFQLPANFGELLKSKYSAALEAGNLVFTGSTSEIKEVDDVNYCFTLAKSLGHRPEKGTKEANPFANPEPELTIVETYGEKYRLVLNKFPITSEHFMMVTKEFVSQNTALSPKDLLGSYTALLAAETQLGKKHFAFYNCGPNSGASQPHKHVQFMRFPDNFWAFPESVVSGVSPFVPGDKREPLQRKDVPFAHFIAPLPSSAKEITEDNLGFYFIYLLTRVMTIIRDHDQELSYNFILTKKWMMLVPRSSPKYKNLGINSAGYVGLMLAKDEELLEMIENDTPGVILADLGFPNTAGQHSEYGY